MKKITDVEMRIWGSGVSVGWNLDGARYHVWLKGDPAHFLLRENTIYKNPHQGTKSTDGSYFHTRQLDALAKSNTDILKAVFAEVQAKNLIQIAREEESKREGIRLQEAAENASQRRIRDLAPEMLEALKEARACFNGQHNLMSTATNEERLAVVDNFLTWWNNKARTIIAKAEGRKE